MFTGDRTTASAQSGGPTYTFGHRFRVRFGSVRSKPMTVSPAIRETGGPPFAGSITPGKSASVRKPLRARKLSRIIRTVDVSRPGGQKSAFEDASKPGVRWSGYIPWNSAHGYCLPCRAAFTDVVGLSLKFALLSTLSQTHGALLNCWVAKRGAAPSATPPGPISRSLHFLFAPGEPE